MTKEELIRYGKDYLHDLETACCPISDIHKEFVREAIKALEIVEEFEKAQIITGGRLNGRTYAYKCGLEAGKRKALEQQSCDCVSRKQAKIDVIPNSLYTSEQVIALLDNLSSVRPTHGTCKDCKHNYKTSRNTFECSNGHRFYMRIPDTFYCADYEKRGSENEIN